jgi:cytochrome c-type biogenesis protein CcmE
MEDNLPAPSPKRRAKFLIGGATIVIALIGLVVWGLGRPGSTAFYMTTSEVVAAGAAPSGEYRVNGTVVPDSIEEDGLVTSFEITDGGTEMTIVTDQPLPDTFKPYSEVVALGSFTGDRFMASEVLAKCPSKFKAKA